MLTEPDFKSNKAAADEDSSSLRYEQTVDGKSIRAPEQRKLPGSWSRTSTEREARSPSGTYGGLETISSNCLPATGSSKDPSRKRICVPMALRIEFARRVTSRACPENIDRSNLRLGKFVCESATAMAPEPVPTSAMRGLRKFSASAIAPSTRCSVSGLGISTLRSTRNGSP